MTSETTTTGMQSWLNQFTNAAPGQFDWTKSVSEGPFKLYGALYKQMLAGAARQLQIQADYVGRLAECKDPGEALAAQSELVQKSVACCVESGQQIATAMGQGVPQAS